MAGEISFPISYPLGGGLSLSLRGGAPLERNQYTQQ